MKLTPEDVRQLEFLKNLTGENQSQVMKRALGNYYHTQIAARQTVKELFGEKK